MKVKTQWYGATFIAETEEDISFLRKMEKWKIEENYEEGKWVGGDSFIQLMR